jgi:hypothetical protein
MLPNVCATYLHWGVTLSFIALTALISFSFQLYRFCVAGSLPQSIIFSDFSFSLCW